MTKALQQKWWGQLAVCWDLCCKHNSLQEVCNREMDSVLAEDKFWAACSLIYIPQACRLLLLQIQLLHWNLSGWRVEVPGSYCAWAIFLGFSPEWCIQLIHGVYMCILIHGVYMCILTASGFFAVVDTWQWLAGHGK